MARMEPLAKRSDRLRNGSVCKAMLAMLAMLNDTLDVAEGSPASHVCRALDMCLTSHHTTWAAIDERELDPHTM